MNGWAVFRFRFSESAAYGGDWIQESDERCDAAFSENREPGDHRMCRKIDFKKIPGKILGYIVLWNYFLKPASTKKFPEIIFTEISQRAPACSERENLPYITVRLRCWAVLFIRNGMRKRLSGSGRQ